MGSFRRFKLLVPLISKVPPLIVVGAVVNWLLSPRADALLILTVAPELIVMALFGPMLPLIFSVPAVTDVGP